MKKKNSETHCKVQSYHCNPPQTTIEKPTNPPSQQNPLNQNQEQTKTNKSKPTNHHNHEQHRFLCTSTLEREMVARARAHWFLAIESTSTSTPVFVGSRSGVASIAGRLWSGEGSRVPPRHPQPRAHRPH